MVCYQAQKRSRNIDNSFVISFSINRDSIRSAMIPTVDAAKTVGLVSLPGMMSGLY